MAKLRKALVAAVPFLLLAGPALADGPSGSSDSNANQTACGKGTRVAGIVVYAGANGAEACSDDNTAPDGRIIVSINGTNSYVAADGDASNPEQVRGWARVNKDGVKCGADDDPKTSNIEDPDSSDGTAGGSCG